MNKLHPHADLNGKSILITGGTGSFGRAFVRHVLARYKPRRLIIFSRDEHKQAEMAQSMTAKEDEVMRFFIGDVRDERRLVMAMRDVDYVVHAAAMKHVPLAEYNPFECINTNVNGAQNVVEAALEAGVKKVIALSTDKAVNPLNLYGASKLAADKIFQAANNLSGRLPTRFSVVRYGNVVGSRGSVVPLFQRLIAEGAKTLPITDPQMTRFWITLEQSIDFVFTAMDMMVGGEIFVPIIPSMRIVDLAKAMAPNLPHMIVGIRPGEKLHEVLVTEDDARNTLELPGLYVIEPDLSFWDKNAHAARGAKRVDKAFRYSSDINREWISADDFSLLLEK